MTSPQRETSRRARIEVAARVEFAAKGFAGARVAHIARDAAVNKQLIFYYFGSKAGLYAAVMEGASRGLPSDERRQEGAPPGHLRHTLADVFAALAARPELVALLGAAEGATRGPARAAARASVERLIGALQSVISDGQGLGYFRDDADPDLVARQAFVLSAGYLSMERLVVDEPSASSRDRWIGEVTDLLLRALSW